MYTAILIVMIHWGYGTAAISTEYGNLKSCETARTEVLKKWDSTAGVVALCTMKYAP